MDVDLLGGPNTLLVILFGGLYLLINLNYLILHTAAIVSLYRSSKQESAPVTDEDRLRPGVAILVPAYNEIETILDSLPSFLKLDYPNLEVIVINDGSTDATLERLKETYDLTAAPAVPIDTPGERIHAVFESEQNDKLRVIDKENGGKSDALNVGLWVADKPLVCAVDADTIIDRESLLEVVQPFYDYPNEVAAAGGTVRVANGCRIENGEVVEVGLARNLLVQLQAMEYLRAFYLGRLGLARFKSLLLISGAFGVFRADLLRDIGGYSEATVTEDFDLILRLHRHLADSDGEYRIEYVPEATAWTEVPVSRRVLGTQRRRWFRGMLETLMRNRDMIGSRRYSWVGIYALPFYILAEVIGPLLEGIGFVVLPLAYAAGYVSLGPVVLFILLTSGFGVLLSWYSLLGELFTSEGYTRPSHLMRLIFAAVIENLGYRQWKTLIAWSAVTEYLRGDTRWGDMERQGLY